MSHGSHLTAIVIGAGFAGEGHTIALQQAGVEVLAMASRTRSAVEAAARRHGIRESSTNWRAALAEYEPDIVAIAAPADTHAEMIEGALEHRCHLLVEKPLAPTAEQARRLRDLVQDTEAKTAYAATAHYQPAARRARELVRQGAIGRVVEAEFVSHFYLPPRLPFGWAHSLEHGGGRLNTILVHMLAIAQSVLGGTVLQAFGEARYDLKKAPVGERHHDYRQWLRSPMSEAEAKRARWIAVDSDSSFNVLARIGVRDGRQKVAGAGSGGEEAEEVVSVLFRHSALHKSRVRDYVAFYGTRGTIHCEKAFCDGGLYLWREGSDDFNRIALADDEADSLIDVPGLSHHEEGWEVPQRAWIELVRQFVADIQGHGHERYYTIHDGWLFQEVIDVARSGKGWSNLPSS